MEKNHTNIYYHKYFSVEYQKWDIVEITNRIFSFAWDLYSLFFIQGVLKSNLDKRHPQLKCQVPPKLSIWSKYLRYKRSQKWPSLPAPITQNKVGWRCELCIFMWKTEFSFHNPYLFDLPYSRSTKKTRADQSIL